MKNIAYKYHNLPIPGGGYATGFLYHPSQEGLLYLRTDIGGVYRFDRERQSWKGLSSHVTMEDLSETFPIAMAVDRNCPQRLYIACGTNREQSGVLAVSEDYGESFSYRRIPALVHGNLNGRGTGERLITDSADSERLFFASQQEGLFISPDRGKSWKKAEGLREQYLTLVRQIALENGTALLVGTAGVTTGTQDGMRGHSLYVSYDGGDSFEELQEPQSCRIPGCGLSGVVAQRSCTDERYLYVTFACTGRRSYVLENGYSCDSGDSIDGHVVRYPLAAGRLGAMEDITPGISASVHWEEPSADHIDTAEISGAAHLEFGLSGISASVQTPGLVIVSTIVKDNGDCIYRSWDYGRSWERILYDLENDAIRFRAPYMKPQYNGGHSLIHWLSDLKLNPFDDNEAWFNTGTGVFRTVSLKDRECYFTDWCDGLEETVHLNVYSLPAGPVKVIDILGDLGGFAFEQLDEPCENSFADSEGNRYITCINADFSDTDPSRVIVTPRGNWKGKTKGGLILSEDYGRSFRRLRMPFGLSAKLDDVLHRIETPNVNSGWAAISPDGRHIVWTVADGIRLPAEQVLVSHDGGESFCLSRVCGSSNRAPVRLKVFSDRVDSSLFYGFGEDSRLYISKDSGSTFYECSAVFTQAEDGSIQSSGLPRTEFGLIDCADKTEIRGECGKRGVFYLALGEGGLWKARYCLPECGLREGWYLKRLSGDGDSVYRVGLGLMAPGSDYSRDDKAIYCCGTMAGVYGFYRSFDDWKSCERINNERQMYGEILSIDGDCRRFGRFYLATGSGGLLYAEPVQKGE